MQILIAGSTGNTGTRLVRELQARGHEPIALVRSSSDTSGLPEGVKQREGDLTNLAEDVTAGCEVVVFAAGAGGGSSEEMTDKVDRDGAKRLIDLSVANNVRRFVMLSSIGAGDPNPQGDLAHYLKAKHAADEHLKSSDLEYVILRPVALTDEDGGGDIRLGDDVDPEGEAARGDVARLLADAAEMSEHVGKAVRMESVTQG
ncbi:SDR family oxidoreductase [Erythrobacter sp.]|uniref:SDR family oxidoreductase n=1 Tax=Erythrobacter sp. TaxID=1042 RepID=UPI0025E86853|nr:SDR family oxidoreductase [Erythrobacter sp.]